MCILCDRGSPQAHLTSRRNFLKGTAATGLAAGAMGLLGTSAAVAQGVAVSPPLHTGTPGRRYVIRNAYVMTMEPGTPGADSAFGEFIEGDVLVEGKTIKAIGKNLHVGNAAEIDARGKVVMPGFIDTHHHQAWTAIRSSIADSVLIDDGTGTASAEQNYFFNVLGGFQPSLPGFANHYTPEDVYISELFGGLSQLDAGVTTVLDISQIHHSREHTDAAVQALRDAGRRAMLGYFESAGSIAGNEYPQDAVRVAKNLQGDALVGLVMGGEVYLGLPTYSQSWAIGRELGVLVAAHILSPFGIRPVLDELAGRPLNDPLSIRSDNLFIHMTGMSDPAWNVVKDRGAKVSIAFPIEMQMRHGVPPILKMQGFNDPAFEPSLSTDVETNMTADFFTQMRSALTMQRMVVNQAVLDSGPIPVNPWPPFPAGLPPLLNARDVLKFATINGAKHLQLESKTGSLKVGKEADIIILDGSHLNVFPMNNVPGAVVTLMERTNVETVIVAGKIRKWKGKLQNVDLDRLRPRLAASRDRIYAGAGKTPTPFPAK